MGGKLFCILHLPLLLSANVYIREGYLENFDYLM